MSKISLISLFLLFFPLGCLFAQTSIIKGVASEYAGIELPVYTLSDFISEEKIEIGKISFLDDGTFSANIKLPFTAVCFVEFDIYSAMLYIEPGKTYEIQFPPRKKQTEAQKRNPFFKLLPVWFRIINQADDDLNLLIKKFEAEYRILENKYFYDIYQQHSRASMLRMQTELREKFPEINNKFFEDYKKYRIANIEYALNQGKSKEFIDLYFGKTNPKLQIPAYSNLFNQLFTNYFSFLGNSIHDQKITGLVNSGDIRELEKYLSVKNAWNLDVCRLIILKSLKDAYYSGQFSKPSIIGALRQVEQSDWSDKYKLIARNILNKVTYLSPGTEAPTVSLSCLDGEKLLSDFKGKYVYLHFTDLKNPVCIQHMEILSTVAEQYKNNLVVVFITEGKTQETEAKRRTGIFAVSTDECKNTYRVKTFPTSFLIDREGKLVLSPALNPLNGFESQLRQILEKERIEKLREK